MKRRVFVGLIGMLGGCVIAPLGAQRAGAAPAAPAAKPPAAAAVGPTYVWPGQVVSFDRTAATVTMKVACKEHIARYIDQFKPGDRVILYGSGPVDGAAEAVIYVGAYDMAATSRIDDQGHVLPVEFVSFDRPANAMTFQAHLDQRGMSRFQTIQPGASVKVTSPMNQAGKGIAAITAVQPADAAKPAPAAKQG
jgi:hypothetical protein